MDGKKELLKALVEAEFQADLWGKGDIVVDGKVVGEVSLNSEFYQYPEPIGMSPLEEAMKKDKD